MVAVEISGSLIVRDKNLLMVYEEEEQVWNVPTDQGQKGELSADTAERVAEEHTGCESEAVKYKKNLKNQFEHEGEQFRLQPYSVEIEGEPEKAEWVKIEEIESKKLAKPLREIVDKLKDKL